MISLKPINCMLYEYFTEATMTATTQSMQLAIDECEEWIWDTLDSTKDCAFEYIKDGIKNFLYSIQMISSQMLKH